jgi:hypothetical protein
MMTDPIICHCDYPKMYHKALSMLTDAQVTVYTVDARGLYAGGTGFEKAEDMLSLEDIAEAGGGIAYYNSSDLTTGIAKAIDTGSDYYTLSYVPPGTEYDGRQHTIHLDADKPDLHLTYRDEYYAEDPSKMMPAVGLTLATTLPTSGPADMRLAMGRAMPTSQKILFDVGVESGADTVKATDPQGTILGTLDPVVKVKLKDKPLIRYNFNYAIPARQIAFSAGPNGTHNGSLELDIAVYDADAKLVTGLSQTVKMPLSDDKYRQFIQGPFRISQQIDLPAGQFFVRIGILDRTSNKVGTLEIPLTVTKGSGVVTAGR